MVHSELQAICEIRLKAHNNIGESAEGTSPSAARKTGRETLASSGFH